jgi:hypothetical protein
MRLTGVLRGTPTMFVYGTCKPSSDGGCAPPLQIQVSSTCDRNPLLLDIRPHARFRARGATVLDYGEGRFELAAGASHVVVWARPALARRAIAALHTVDGPLGAGPLPRARYPRTYGDELARVQDAYARTQDLRAVRDQLHISKSQVAFELALADDLDRQGRHRTARCPMSHR